MQINSALFVFLFAKKRYFKNGLMKFKVILVFILTVSISSAYAQKIVRSSLNTFGNVVQNNGLMLSQTAGQSSNHSVFYAENNKIELRQGFQQTHSGIKVSNRNGLQFT